jgi:hypothetical protein
MRSASTWKPGRFGVRGHTSHLFANHFTLSIELVCGDCQIPGVAAGMACGIIDSGNKGERMRTVERMCKTQDRDMCL